MAKILNFSRNVVFFFVLMALGSFLITSCSSTQKMIDNGQYNNAIPELVKELLEKESSKKIELLNEIYPLANKQDLDEIQNLKASGQPDIWQKVYFHYFTLNARQLNVSQLSPEILQTINVNLIDYSGELENARQKSATYYYALATKCMSDSNSRSTPSAYDYLNAVNNIYPGFRDVDELMAEIKSHQPTNIYYHFKNDYPYTLPPGSAGNLENIDLSAFDTPKYHFVNSPPQDHAFDVFAELSLTHVKISPEQTGELAYTESVKIQDGIAYRLDENGGFVLDDEGKKIEAPKFKTLVCYVSEYKQEKSMLLIGNLELIDRASEKIIGMETIEGESKFVNIYAKFKGDVDALSPETFEFVGTKKLDYPTDAEMIKDAGKKLGEDAAIKVIEMLGNVEL